MQGRGGEYQIIASRRSKVKSSPKTYELSSEIDLDTVVEL